MKLQVVSDLHLEFESVPLVETDADVVVIAGDLCPIVKRATIINFLNEIDKPVIWVPGNHEYYGTFFGNEIELPEHVHWLDNDVITIDDVTFAGSTFWTSPPSRVFARINDKYQIFDFDIHHAHLTDKIFLANLKFADVIVTHFPPSMQSCNPIYRGDDLTPYFIHDEEDMVGISAERLWIHGHTHNNADYMLNAVRVISNQKGYYGENKEYHPNLVVEV